MRKLLIFVLLSLVLASSVFALGIAPSRKEVFFEPLEEKENTFRIINNDHKDMEIVLVANGELSNYISVPEKVHISSEESEKTVNYKFNFPNKLSPGIHEAEIIAIESPRKVNGQDGTILVANVGVIHKVIIKVPYPEEYLEGILFISDARPNELVTFTASLSNIGNQDLEYVNGNVIVIGPDEKPVAQIATNIINLGKNQKSKVTADWIANVDPGTYTVQVIIEYGSGKILLLEKEFDVGEPLLEIEDLRVGSFKIGTIAKFDIMLRSKWNKDIPDVYGTTEISDENGALLETYKTSTAIVPSQGLKELNSYWDTKAILPGDFIIAVKINYFGRLREKVYEMSVKDDRIDIKGISVTGEVVQSEEGEPFNLNFGDKSLILVLASLVFVLILLKIILDFIVKMKKVEKEK